MSFIDWFMQKKRVDKMRDSVHADLVECIERRDILLELLENELKKAIEAMEKYKSEQDMIISVARNLVTLLILNPGIQNQDTEAVLSQLANLLMKER